MVLGTVYQRHDRYRKADEHLERALALFREIGDRVGEADALAAVGSAYQRQRRYH